MMWNWIKETYGALEAIEGALFKKTEFPKISNKAHLKLQDLADLLMELEIATKESCCMDM